MIAVYTVTVMILMGLISWSLFRSPGIIRERKMFYNGLGLHYTGNVSSWRLTGEYRGCTVTACQTSGNNSSFTLTVSHKGMPSTLRLLSRRFGTVLARLFSDHEVLVGDTHFDEAVHVNGGFEHSGFLLHAKARKQILKLLGRWNRSKLEDGEWVFSGSCPEPKEFTRLLTALTDAAIVLSQPPEGSLLACFEAETAVEVQKQLLNTLLKKGGKDAQRALQTGIHSRVPAIRFQCVMALGNAQVTQAFVRDPSMPTAERLEAWIALFGLDKDMSDAMILEVLAQPSTLTAVALKRAKVRGIPLDADCLNRLQTVADFEVQVSLVRFLDSIGDQDRLLAQLESTESTSNELILKALGRIGDLSMVYPLQKHAKSHWGLGSETRDAVQMIQARHSGPSGGLALVREGGGGLSIPKSAQLETPES